MKFLTNLTEISQSPMIIQLPTHYTKSILKSLINQLCDISRCNTQSNLIIRDLGNRESAPDNIFVVSLGHARLTPGNRLRQ